jgi:hypothetical protein
MCSEQRLDLSQGVVRLLHALVGPLSTLGLSEEVQRESVRLANAEASMTPSLSRQMLVDRKALLNSSPVCLFDVVDFDHHKDALRGPVIPKVGRITAPGSYQDLDYSGCSGEEGSAIVCIAVPRL